MELFNLKGKKAIVTGGNRGIGKSIVEGYLNAGIEVAIIARNPSLTAQVKEYCDKGFTAYAIFADLSNKEERGTAFDQAVAQLGGLDILVNVAGVQIRHPAEEFPLEDFDKVLEVNLNATFDYCQRAARVMLPNKYGKIINFASMLSFFGGYTVPAYAASKGGVAQITKAFSNEWTAKGINVNAIAPGYMATEMNTALINNPIRNDAILARIPAGRWGTGEDCVGPALFLASQASDYLSGMIMPVDGGFMAR